MRGLSKKLRESICLSQRNGYTLFTHAVTRFNRSSQLTLRVELAFYILLAPISSKEVATSTGHVARLAAKLFNWALKDFSPRRRYLFNRMKYWDCCWKNVVRNPLRSAFVTRWNKGWDVLISRALHGKSLMASLQKLLRRSGSIWWKDLIMQALRPVVMMLDAFILLDYFPKDHPLEGR